MGLFDGPFARLGLRGLELIDGFRVLVCWPEFVCLFYLCGFTKV